MPQLSAPVKAVRLAAAVGPKAKSLTSMPSLYDSIVAASKAIKYGVPAVGVGGLALFAKSSAETKEAAFRVLEKSAAFEKEAHILPKLIGGVAKAPKLLSGLFSKLHNAGAATSQSKRVARTATQTKAQLSQARARARAQGGRSLSSLPPKRVRQKKVPIQEAPLELPKGQAIVRQAPVSELNPNRAPTVMWDNIIAKQTPAGVAPTTVMPEIHPNKVPGFTPNKSTITAADLEAAKAVSIAAPTRFQNAVDGFRAGWGNRASVMPTTPVGGVFDRAHTAGRHIYNNRGTYGVAAGLGGMGVVDHSIDAARKRALENMSPLQRMRAAGSLLFSPKSLTNKIW